MKYTDNPIRTIKEKLDQSQERLKMCMRIQQSRSPSIDDKLTETIEKEKDHYTMNLEHLRRLKAYDEVRAYTEWYKRFLNAGDPA